ncbi:hypothetical protein [Reyranella sp.]|uniref:hypothetical protein n=1 Tax=Reyranella sp. TaxID=1929291 RepID=UPI0011FC7B9E|nr:hypothetical protein [Reyranella sp.]TAJ91016.1 MAG: hypothetical protein EPO50_00360 [Reyranella sp.]
MNSLRLSAGLLTAFLLAGASVSSVAQTPPAPTATTQGHPKTVGKAGKPHLIPSMIVLNARGAKLQGKQLILDGVSPNAIVFADRPVRAAGHALTAHVIEEWSNNAPDSFAKDPPNATVSVLNKAKASVVDAVLTLRAPKLDGDKLTFDVDVLEGDLAGADGAVSVFMDIINLPSPRRTSHRSAWYAGAN